LKLHDRAGEFTSVLFAQQLFWRGIRVASRQLDLSRDAELPARRPRSGPRCLYDELVVRGEALLRDAVVVPDDWMLAGHIVVGWPKGRHGPLRRRPVAGAVNYDHWDD
jgi:hypothetical protein